MASEAQSDLFATTMETQWRRADFQAQRCTHCDASFRLTQPRTHGPHPTSTPSLSYLLYAPSPGRAANQPRPHLTCQNVATRNATRLPHSESDRLEHVHVPGQRRVAVREPSTKKRSPGGAALRKDKWQREPARPAARHRSVGGVTPEPHRPPTHRSR